MNFAAGALGREAGNRPLADFHAVKKLLPSHVPDAAVGQRLGFGSTPVLQLGRRQDPTPHLHQILGDRQTELLHEGIVVEVRPLHQVGDLSLAIRRRSRRRLNPGLANGNKKTTLKNPLKMGFLVCFYF